MTAHTAQTHESTTQRTAWGIAITAVAVNAIAQSVLVITNPIPPLTWWIWPLALASFAFFVVTVTVVLAAMGLGHNGANTRASTPASVLALARSRLFPMVAYSAAVLVVAVIGFAFWVLPGLVVLAASPYLLFAVMDHHPRPLRGNFRAIGAHPIRWLVSLVVTGMALGIVWAGSSLQAFFLPGALGTIGILFVSGLVLVGLAKWWYRNWRLACRSGPREKA